MDVPVRPAGHRGVTVAGSATVDAGEESAGTVFDDTTDTVRIRDVATLRNGCESLDLAAADVDAGTSTCAVGVVTSDDGACTQQVVDEPFVVEATFADGLPGTVDYDGPN